MRNTTFCRWLAFTGMIAGLIAFSSKPGQAGTAGCIAAFDFELMDSSLVGQVNGPDAAEQQRLEMLSSQLRQWIDQKSSWKSCDMEPVMVEAKSANLSACGCIPRLAQSVGAAYAVTSTVHKVSNLILNIRVDVIDVASGKLVLQQNADIRSNSDRSWQRGLDWLIRHRLGSAFAKLKEAQQ